MKSWRSAMNNCAIEKLIWIVAVAAIFGALQSGNVQSVGMKITVMAALWYGLVCPLAEELEVMNSKSKGSVN